MKKISLIILVLTCFKFYSCESGILTYETDECDKTQEFNYNDIIHFDYMQFSSDVYMVGDTGAIIPVISSENCELYPLKPITTKNLNAIDGPTESYCVIVGDSGVIIKDLIDLSESGTNHNLNDVIRGWLEGTYIAVGDSGTILRSTDYGYEWVRIPVVNTDTLVHIEKGVISGSLKVLGKSGFYLSSTDDGLTWTSRTIFFEGLSTGLDLDLKSLKFINETTGWVSGTDGTILRTFNGGIFWFRQQTNTSESINFINFNSYLNGYAVGDNGTVLFTTNAGNNWLPHPGFDTVTTKNFKSFIKKDSLTYLAIGDSGLFMRIQTGFNTDPLSGIYSVGATGDFENLKTSCLATDYLGIKDDVVFEIENGIYNEQLVINDIYGSSSEKTVTFRSAANNPGGVILEFASAAAFTNYTVLFNGAKNIIFENVTINALDTGFSRAAELRGICSNIIFRNVIFNGQPATGNSINKSVVMSSTLSTTNLSSIDFEDCVFNNGTFGLRLVTPFTSVYFNNINVINNSFGGQSNAAINFSNLENYSLNLNQINNSQLGIALSNCRNFSLNKNSVSSITSGIDLTGCTSNNALNNIVSNNFIQSGFFGIRMVGPNSNNSFYFNSVNIKDVTDTASAATSSGFITALLSGTNNRVNNNLFINGRRGTSFSSSSGNTYSSINFNNYYTQGTVLAQLNGVNYSTFDSYKSASGRDTNSASVPVEFLSDSDLHLMGISHGDTSLIGKPITNINDDIDFDTRHPEYPYMGADEIPSAPLPVELSSFTSAVNGRDVILNWVTSAEINNHGFDIERMNGQGNIIKWNKTGFITGNGTTNSFMNYSFTDRGLNSGKYKYRLKQIDVNGNFKYYNLASEVVIGIPQAFSLSQNYPNPFNPSTKINYDVPVDGMVSLKVYDVLGREVITLVNEFVKAGYYSVNFNKKNSFSSGVYFYRIQTSSFADTKRMVLLK